MNNSSSSTSEANSNDGAGQDQTPGPYGYSIGVSFGVILLLIVITYCYYIYTRYRAATANNQSYFLRRNSMMATATAGSQRSPHQGLDETTLEAYPKILFSQAKTNHEGGGSGGDSGTASACSICLQDYKDADWLRLLPKCGHFFHLKCVDPWLMLHPTCPICRNSPVPEILP